MTTYHENRSFICDVISQTLLDDVMEWIERKKEPDEVYDKAYLKEWAIETFGLIDPEWSQPS